MQNLRSIRVVSVVIVIVALGISSRNFYRRYTQKTLINAINLGDEDTALALLKSGVPIDQTKRNGLLFYAALNNEADVVKRLLDQGADVNSLSFGGVTPLMIAADRGSLKIVQLLLERGADVNIKDRNEYSMIAPASTALGRGSAAFKEPAYRTFVKLLLTHGADPNGSVMYGGSTALYWAAQKGDLYVVKLLMARGAKIGDKGSALMAAPDGRSDIVRAMLDMSPASRSKTQALTNALVNSVNSGQEERVKLFLLYGARPDTGSPAWLWALHAAREHHRANLLALLQKAGIPISLTKAEIEVRDRTQQTPLLIALARGDTSLARTLLKENANVNVTDSFGMTPLLQAIEHCPALVGDLLAKQAEPNYIAPFASVKRSPLSQAVINGNIIAVRQLLSHGANVNMRPIRDHTALYYAHKHNQTDIAEVLKAAGGRDE